MPKFAQVAEWMVATRCPSPPGWLLPPRTVKGWPQAALLSPGKGVSPAICSSPSGTRKPRGQRPQQQRGGLGSLLASWFLGDTLFLAVACRGRGTRAVDLALCPAEAAVGTTEVMSGGALSTLREETLYL